MSKYPEEIVEKVADAIRRATDDGADRAEDYAIAALDALDLERQVQGPRFYKDSSSARYVTPWVVVDQ